MTKIFDWGASFVYDGIVDSSFLCSSIQIHHSFCLWLIGLGSLTYRCQTQPSQLIFWVVAKTRLHNLFNELDSTTATERTPLIQWYQISKVNQFLRQVLIDSKILFMHTGTINAHPLFDNIKHNLMGK